jgi:copper(I)-binding protein
MIQKTALALGLLFAVAAAHAAPLQFRSARIPEAPPGARAMAAYMTIVNDSERERIITDVSSDDFGEVQVHRSVVEDGVAKMEPLESLRIPPGESVTLEPGGIHLMLIEPKDHYIDGELLRLVFEESDGTRHALGVNVEKQRRQPESPAHRHE